MDILQLILFDAASTKGRLPNLASPADEAIAISGDGGAAFFTMGEMTDVVVEFELWTAKPVPPGLPFPDDFEGNLTVDTRHLVLGSVTGSPADVVIDLPRPGSFRLRAFRNSTTAPNTEFPELDY